jgi:4-hydroxy-4-methyl-2-oxoglutarate aldolase
VWGDLLTLTAHRRRIGGTVIDGICRDTNRALELGYPIWSRGAWMRTGKDRVRVDAVQGPVSCAGVRVEPGDLLLGDADGTLAIPAGRADEVLEHALAIAAAERTIREQVEEGETLRAARTAVGYHRLQTRR